MSDFKKFAVVASFHAARSKIDYEMAHGARGYEFKISKQKVGRSVDPAYSDKDGYQYVIWYRLGK